MEKNRIVSLILVLCLGLTLLAGCGSKKTSDGDKATATLILIDQDEKGVHLHNGDYRRCHASGSSV